MDSSIGENVKFVTYAVDPPTEENGRFVYVFCTQFLFYFKYYKRKTGKTFSEIQKWFNSDKIHVK